MREALKAGGSQNYPEASKWQDPKIGKLLKQYKPVPDRGVVVQPSRIDGAGLGLFANASLPQGSVIQYIGEVQTYAQYKQKKDSNYVLCPNRLMGATDDFLEARSGDVSFCVDSEPWTEQNPARYANNAVDLAQCAKTNAEMCELGDMFYLRTTKDVSAGTELFLDLADGTC
eukprot:CAMPEP_0198551316 /NCGR_PEP_ID=MMETSP1462-20131121/76477_1 /TAXON_ID=1333877 /ORGANISM="Brandtodinium nutriculum, Strain RCC3387" /LENGTH=171 /DNA_ID=CAMNT_0044281951 /DNA_START=118 /DNA_END=633 /DNA_ORIENTATION=+